MASLTMNPPPAKRLKTSATNNNNTSLTIKTISLVPFIDDFINTRLMISIKRFMQKLY